MHCTGRGADTNQSPRSGRSDLLADLTGNVRLQSAREDLVYDAVTVVGVVGLLPIIITCRNASTGSEVKNPLREQWFVLDCISSNSS